jgi:hypothetical protein
VALLARFDVLFVASTLIAVWHSRAPGLVRRRFVSRLQPAE